MLHPEYKIDVDDNATLWPEMINSGANIMKNPSIAEKLPVHYQKC